MGYLIAKLADMLGEASPEVKVAILVAGLCILYLSARR